MPWPNIFWLIVGLDCQWVMGSGGGGYVPYVVLTDVYVIPLLLVLLVGITTCVRWLLRLTREERTLHQFRQQAQRASADYLYPYL